MLTTMKECSSTCGWQPYCCRVGACLVSRCDGDLKHSSEPECCSLVLLRRAQRLRPAHTHPRMAPSPVRYRTPDGLDQDSWQLPSPPLRSHTIPYADPALPSDSFCSRPEAPAGTVTSFEQRLASAQMPPPGPAYFHARRALWWQPTVGLRQPPELPRSRRNLEDLLASEDAHENDEIWRAGVGKVNQALADGAQFKHHMPLRFVVRVVATLVSSSGIPADGD